MKAYVMIKTEAGKDIDILREINKWPDFQEVHRLFGIYDIIVETSKSDLPGILAVVDKLRAISGIRETITSLVVDLDIDTRDIPL